MFLFQVRINFKWQDAFDKESLFGGKKILCKFTNVLIINIIVND